LMQEGLGLVRKRTTAGKKKNVSKVVRLFQGESDNQKREKGGLKSSKSKIRGRVRVQSQLDETCKRNHNLSAEVNEKENGGKCPDLAHRRGRERTKHVRNDLGVGDNGLCKANVLGSNTLSETKEGGYD